eukprot:Opistho-1_new@109035
MKKILSAQNLHKVYAGDPPLCVLKGVFLEVAAGESVAIMGKSGEGKSTLLHILGTLEEATEGELTLMDTVITPTPSSFALAQIRNRHLGFIFQAFHLLEDYTVLENVLMPAQIAGMATSVKSPSYKRGLALLEKVGLLARTHFLTKNLSGGEKQRVALARALFNEPKILLADEPTGSLDYAHSVAIHELLLTLCKSSSAALLIATHDPQLALLCDRILVLKEGLLHPVEKHHLRQSLR